MVGRGCQVGPRQACWLLASGLLRPRAAFCCAATSVLAALTAATLSAYHFL